MTGHLVFSTVHANDATSTILRLLDLGIPPFLLGSSLNLVMAQRLVRTLDKDSKESYNPSKEELERVRFPDSKLSSSTIYKAVPTRNNHNTGYKGRTAIHEILEVDNSIKKLIFSEASQSDIKEVAIKN